TTDAGATWTRLNVTSSLWGTQMWFDNTIRVSPKDPNVVWAGGLQVYRSLNGGTTWTAPPQAGSNGTSIHLDFHALALTPHGSRLYLGNDGGIYTTTDVSSTSINWAALNSALATTKFYGGMTLNPGNAAFAIAGTQDNGTQQLASDGSWRSVTCGDGGFTAVD